MNKSEIENRISALEAEIIRYNELLEFEANLNELIENGVQYRTLDGFRSNYKYSLIKFGNTVDLSENKHAIAIPISVLDHSLPTILQYLREFVDAEKTHFDGLSCNITGAE